ncbi:MAG: hypothetical protein NTW94_00430 [Legionellales bacterium]|nr:hypothetical protein [Legionellales bacterium]
MKIDLDQLLPANISNEAAFHVVKFVRDLALALEFIYFDHMLQHLGMCEDNPFAEDEYECDELF